MKFVMLGNGCCIPLGAPAYILGVAESDTAAWHLRVYTHSSRRRKVYGRHAFSLENGGECERHRGQKQSEAKMLDIPVTNAQINLNGSDYSFLRNGRAEEALKPHTEALHRLRPGELNLHESNILQSPISPHVMKESQPNSVAASSLPSAEERGQKATETEKSPNDEDWRSLSRAITTGQNFSTISNHDLMKIAELRFSNDMQEGDVGSQVILLQKALFWLGYLSQQSETTGYFGIGTKQALCEFQEAHGVHKSGTWGALSKQALWHNISGEILHRAADEKAGKTPETSEDCGVGKSVPAFQVWQLWSPYRITDAWSGLNTEGNWKLLSGMILLVVGIMFGLLLSKSSPTESSKGNYLKRKIIRASEQENSSLPLRTNKQSGLQDYPKEAAVNQEKASELAHKTPTIRQVENVRRSEFSTACNKGLNSHPSKGLYSAEGTQHSSDTSAPSYRLGKKSAYSSTASPYKNKGSKTGFESSRKDRHALVQSKRPGGGASSAMVQDDRYETSPRNRSLLGRLHPESREQFETSPTVSANSTATSQRKMVARPHEKLEKESVAQTKYNSPETGAEIEQHEEDELSIRKRIEELRKAIEAAEQNGQAAVHALAEERQRSFELEAKISKQREAAATLEEEVRILKESHDALLASLRKKLSSTTTERGTPLLYHRINFDADDEDDDGGYDDSNGEARF